jgi:hypothetical protein
LAHKVLTTLALNRALLARQLLLKRRRMSVRDAVHAVGALQSQEPRDPHVALWSRLAGFTSERLMSAARKKQIVRATYLRGTLHTLSAEDYAAFRMLLQPVLDRGLRQWRHVGGGFEMKELERAACALMADDALTAQQLADALAPRFPKAHKAGLGQWVRNGVALAIPPSDDRWGYPRPPRFVAAEPWLGQPLKTDGSLQDMVLRCIAAVGPCSAADVRSWSALTGIQPALAALRPQLVSFKDEAGRELFDLPDAPRPREDTPAPVRFLPEYDNVFLSHAERSRIVPRQHIPHFTQTNNGRRLRAVLIDGFVRGGWSVETKDDSVTLFVLAFEKSSKATLAELEQEAQGLMKFIEPGARSYKLDLRRP